MLVYLVVTAVAVLVNGYAAVLNFAGAESVRAVADRVHVAHKWMVPLGTLLAAGALGLVAGFAVPVLGLLAATGLTLYFCCAIGVHVLARDRGVGGAVFFLAVAAAALIVNLGHR